MTGTLVEISGQKLSTRLLRLESACSLSEGCVSFSIASSPPAELTIVAAIIAAAQSLRYLGEKEGSQTLTGRRGAKRGWGYEICVMREKESDCFMSRVLYFLLRFGHCLPNKLSSLLHSDFESLFCFYGIFQMSFIFVIWFFC